MKYIIEIEDEPYFSGGKIVYRMSGAYVYFSEEQFEKLTPYAESDTAEQAWKIAQDILKDPGKDGMLNGELNDCFGTDDIYLIGAMSYAEVKAKYDAWQEKKAKIKVGDEVERDDGTAVFVVTSRDEMGMYEGFNDTGDVLGGYHVHKTGRHFPEIADLLEKMREHEMTFTECTHQNTCYDCDDGRCWGRGDKGADCPKYRCDRPEDLRLDCDHCAFIDRFIRDMRRIYENRTDA